MKYNTAILQLRYGSVHPLESWYAEGLSAFERIGDHRVRGIGAGLQGQEGLVGFAGRGALHAFLGAAAVVVNLGEVAERGHIVEEDAGGFAFALFAGVEFG